VWQFAGRNSDLMRGLTALGGKIAGIAAVDGGDVRIPSNIVKAVVYALASNSTIFRAPQPVRGAAHEAVSN
jgi:hypothetical protein